jgi:hypothetical protein
LLVVAVYAPADVAIFTSEKNMGMSLLVPPGFSPLVQPVPAVSAVVLFPSLPQAAISSVFADVVVIEPPALQVAAPVVLALTAVVA